MARIRCVIPAVHIVHHIPDLIEEIRLRRNAPFPGWPIGCVQIFDHVEPARTDLRQQYVQRCLDVLHDVTAIIQHDVDAAHFRNHLVQKCRIVLRSDAHLAVDAVIGRASGGDVDPENRGIRPKILAPHGQ